MQDQQGPDCFEYGGVYKSTDGGESWTRVNSVNPRPMYFSQIRVDPSDDKYLYVLGITLYRSTDGGKTFKDDGSNGVHPDQHALWIDPKDGRHMLVGCDGGFYVTYDRMDHWDFLNQMAIGQFYSVCVDSRQPYRVYGGLQDNGSWGGPSRSLSGALLNEDWIAVLGGDGFVCQVDPSDPDIVYSESQDGSMVPAQPEDRPNGWHSTERPDGQAGVPLQLEYAVHPVAPQPAHPLQRRQLRLPLRRAGRRSADHLAGDHAAQSAARPRPWPNRRRIPTCCGPAPTTAPCG